MPSTAILSEEKVQDSSDEESSGRPEAGHRLNGKPSGAEKNSKTKPSAIDSLIDDTSSDESHVSVSSSKSSGSSASAGSKRKAIETNKATLDPPAKRSKMNLAKVKRVESATYVPPQGYTANRMQSFEITSQAQGIFKDLDGKQIWQISAPASFPISKLQSLNVQAALSGEALLQHKGINYIMSHGNSGETALLTPKPNGEYVRTANISRVFNIRGRSDTTTRPRNENSEDTRLSQSAQHNERDAASSEPNVFFATQTGHKKSPRKQPVNLRARYVPFGVVTKPARTENEDVQDGDVPMTDASPEPARSTQINPQITPKSTKKSKTKKAHSPEIIVEETPSKRKKEKRAVSSSQEGLLGSESSQQKKKEKSRT